MMLPGPEIRRVALCSLMALHVLALAGCRPSIPDDPESAPARQAPMPTTHVAVSVTPTDLPTALPPKPPTPTATPPRLLRLTRPGCCVRPGWSPDSLEVVFVDKPTQKDSAGVYGVSLEGGSTRLIYRRPQVLSADWALSTWPEGEYTRVWRRSDGKSWLVDTTGAAPQFSPDSTMLAWAVTSKQYSQIDVRQTAIWVAQINGADSAKVVTLQGGSLIGWMTDGSAVLVSGRMQGGGQAGVWRVPLDEAAPVLLFAADRVRDPVLSPGGRWLAFYVAFAAEAGANGLWVLDTLSGSSQRITPFGAYRWRDENRLLLFPLDDSLPAAELWQVDVLRSEIRQLTDSRVTPLAIANNDWQPSPDGKWLAFVSGVDHAIWILELPPE
jgi:Tol biopolymer transport system component